LSHIDLCEAYKAGNIYAACVREIIDSGLYPGSGVSLPGSEFCLVGGPNAEALFKVKKKRGGVQVLREI